jgi:hypothetical protein
MSYLRIPKVRVVISKLVERIAYDPFGIFGSTNPQDYITITANRPTLSAIKGFNDPFSSLDAIVFKYLAGRRITDSVTLTDVSIVQFVSAVLREFSETTTFVDRPFLLQIPATLRDSISLDDTDIRFIRLRDQKPQDSIDVADTFSRTISAYRVFADAVGMIDNFTLIDGSTYTLDKGIREFLTVGSDIPVRVSNNAAENIAFFANKVLLSDPEVTDRVAKYLDKQLDSNDQPVTDAAALWNNKVLADVFNLTSADTRYAIKSAADSFDVSLEALAFVFLKSLADTASMIDNLDLGDQLVYSSIKDLDDAFDQFDNADFYIAKTANTDSVTQADTDSIQFTKGLQSDFSLGSIINSYYINKGLTESAEISEVLRILRPYVYTDTVTITDVLSGALTRNRFFFDTVGAADLELLDTAGDDDAAVQLLDGINRLLIGKRNTDTASPSDYLARAANYKRYPYQGFTSTAVTAEASLQQLGIGLNTGVYQNIPLLRTNLIYFSEQFGAASYWERTNVSVDSDAINHPDLFYSSTAILYDSSYEAANIMEIFEGYQYRNPAGRAWYREAKLNSQTINVSAADLIIEDAVAGQHFIEATAEADFTAGERFVFGVNLKQAARRYVRIDVAGEFFAIFDLNAGVVVGTNADSAQMGRTGEGWFLCSLTARLPDFTRDPLEELKSLDLLLNSPDNPRAISRFALTPSTRAQTIRISAVENSSLTQTYTGTGTGAFYAWGAQLEIGDQVEFELSSLTYIKTAGGQLSRYGFNINPADGDRLFVGSLHRHRDIWPTRLHNDERERVDFLITSKYADTALPTERKALTVTRAVKLDQNLEFSGTTVIAGTDSEVVFVGGTANIVKGNDPSESLQRFINIGARRGFNDDPAYSTSWTRTNLFTYSEDFRPQDWLKSNVVVFRSPILTSGNLPYRSTTYDANQLYEIFDVPTPNTYYQNRWYEEVPLSDLPDYTGVVVNDGYETIINGEHLLQTRVLDNNEDRDIFSLGVYASPLGGVSRFRLQVNNNIFADFDLSSVSVVTSSTIFYSTIQTIDSSNQVYLCRIIGPAVRITETLEGRQVDEGVVVGTSDTIRLQSMTFRIFTETPLVSEDNIIYGLVTDFQTGSDTEDYMTSTVANIDYMFIN